MISPCSFRTLLIRKVMRIKKISTMGYYMIKNKNLRTKAEKYNLVSKENHHWDLWAETGNKETKRITWLRGNRDKIGSSNLKRTLLKELCRLSGKLYPLQMSSLKVSVKFLLLERKWRLTLWLADKICDTPYCQPYNSHNVGSENLVLDQLIIPKVIFFHYSHHSSGWYFIYIVRRNSVLVTHGS